MTHKPKAEELEVKKVDGVFKVGEPLDLTNWHFVSRMLTLP